MTCSIGKRLSIAVASALLAGPVALVAGAGPAHASVEGCSQKSDNRSADNWTSATWKICVGDYSGPHGEADADCWVGQTIGWNASRCMITGRFEIRKDGQTVKADSFSLFVPLDGTATAIPFRFSCQGNGSYTFTTSGVQATLLTTDSDGNSIARSGYQSANIADATATVTMC